MNRDEVRSYVAKLDDQFAIDPANAVVTGLVDGRPQIADSTWGREVRRQTMVRAIVRTLRTRIRQAVPLVTKTLKPSVSKARLRPGDRDPSRVELAPALQRRDSVAELQRCDRPLSVPDSDRQLPDRRHADEPVVAPARLRLGEGPEADPARPRKPARDALDGPHRPRCRDPRDPDAASIGYSASHGCIRMLISDATWLFDHVSIGTPVLIVD